MGVYIDNDPFETAEPTLAGVLDAARRRVEPAGRIVVEVRLDGEAVSDEAFERSLGEPVAGRRVQMLTADPRELALSTLDEVGGSLGLAREAQKQAAELLTADRPADALEHVRIALAGWGQVQLAVRQSARLLGVDLDAVRVGDRPLTGIIAGLAEQLAAVREQLVDSDWVALADTLGYEMDDAAAAWIDALGALGRHIREV